MSSSTSANSDFDIAITETDLFAPNFPTGDFLPLRNTHLELNYAQPQSRPLEQHIQTFSVPLSVFDSSLSNSSAASLPTSLNTPLTNTHHAPDVRELDLSQITVEEQQEQQHSAPHIKLHGALNDGRVIEVLEGEYEGRGKTAVELNIGTLLPTSVEYPQ